MINVTFINMKIYEEIFNFMTVMKPLILFYSGWVIIHYVSSQLYNHFCAPNVWYGIFISPFLSVTPHCNAFRWIITEAGNVFNAMWVGIGSWIITNLLTKK